MVQSREFELRQKIVTKRREQYLATRDIIVKADAKVAELEAQLKLPNTNIPFSKADLVMYSSNRDVIYSMAECNRRVYDYEIDRIHDEIKLLHEKDPEKIRIHHLECKRKTAYYQLIGDHTGTPYDVRRHIYERIPTATGVCRKGILERIKIHMISNVYELEHIFQRALYLYDLELKDCITDIYTLVKTLRINGPLIQFVNMYHTTYLIPDKMRRFKLRAKLFKRLPLCEDIVCEIFSFLNDEKLCSRKMIDSVVYLREPTVPRTPPF
jgi:hypothetical protein